MIKKAILMIVLIFWANTMTAKAFVIDTDIVANLFYKTADVLVAKTINLVDYLKDKLNDPNNYKDWAKLDDFKFSLPTQITSTSTKAVGDDPIKVTETVRPEVVKLQQEVRPVPVTVPVPAPEMQTGILKFTNEERVNTGLKPLAKNVLLDKVAELRLKDLFSKQYFAHESPTGETAAEVTKQIGYEYKIIGENLALGTFDGDKGIVKAWMASPGHRANIINSQYLELGVAQARGDFKGDTVTIAVQIFGSSSKSCAKPNTNTQALIISSTDSIKKMQAQAKVMYDQLAEIKNNVNLDVAYYNQKVQEYNVFAKNINEAISALKIMADQYNLQVKQYNLCIS